MPLPPAVRCCACLTLCFAAVAFLQLSFPVQPMLESSDSSDILLVRNWNWTQGAAVDEGECTKLGELEAAADGQAYLTRVSATDSSENSAISAFMITLAAWRDGRRGPQPGCRTGALAKSLCAEGTLLGSVKRLTNKEPTFWEKNMEELQQHVSTKTDCDNFHKYIEFNWEPKVFGWIQSSFSMQNVVPLLQDPEYQALYAKAGHLAPHFGPPESLVFTWQGHLWQKKRVQNLNYLRLLRRVVPGLDLTQVRQFVEFGGGSGDLAACLFDLGFSGTHLVLDLPAMTLMQRYWLRYSGVPVFLGQNLASDPAAARGRTVLESSAEGTTFGSHLDPAAQRDSIFMGTYSFTEADLESRERIRPLIQKFGVIFIVFWSSFFEENNDAYMQRWLDEELYATHNVLSWKHEGNGFYFVAVRKDVGDVECAAEFNCHWSKYHHSLPFGGLRGFILRRAMLGLAIVGVLLLLWYLYFAREATKSSKVG